MTRKSCIDVPGALHDVMTGSIYGAKKNGVARQGVCAQGCGNAEAGARNDYSRFVRKGIEHGGLLRSHGGWTGVKSLKGTQKGAERILRD